MSWVNARMGWVNRRLVVSGGLIAFLVVAAVFPLVSSPYRNLQWTLVLTYAIVALGLNMLVGRTGQISLGHSAFFALGAYTIAILVQRFHTGMLLNFVAAAIVTFVAGLIFGIPALRLKGLYLALVTIGLAIVVPALLKRFGSLTGGVQGIGLDPVKAPEWSGLGSDQWLYYVALLIAVLATLVTWNLVRGPVGRSMLAVHDNEIVATTIGVDLARVKTMTFAISAMFAGVAGGLYAYAIAFVSPDAFNLLMAISFLAASVVGGVSTVTGAWIGAAFIEFVPAYASDVNPSLSGLIYGVVLIAVMLLAPKGVVGTLSVVAKRLVGPVAGSAVPRGDAVADRSTHSDVTKHQKGLA